MHRFSCLFLLLLCYGITPSQPVLYSLTEKDGLTDNRVTCFFQDSRGVMWLGTGFGLNAFNGSVIKNYTAGTGIHQLTDNAVNDIAEDKQQNLWLATGNGLCRFSLQNEQCTPYRFKPEKEEAANRYYSLSLNGNQVLLATENGLQVFDIPTEKFTLYKNNAPGNGNNRITRIFTDSRNRVWLCTYNGLWQFNIRTQQFTACDHAGNDPLFDGLVNDIFEDHAEQLWFGTWSRGLKKLNPDTRTVESFLHYAGSNTNLLSIAEQKNSNGSYTLWTNGNLSRLVPEEKRFVPLTDPANDKNSLSTAARLYCSRDNLLWISTEAGVKIYNPARQYFQTRVLSTSVPLTSQGMALFPLNGKLLMGGEGGTALLLLNDSLQQLKNLSAQMNGGAAVMNIQADAANRLWLCTSNGLLILDSGFRPKKLFLHNDRDPASLPKNFLNTLLFRKNGETWIMPWRRGIWRTDEASGKFSRVITAANDTLLPAANISKALEDANGNTWLTDLTGGLFLYEPGSGRVTNIITGRRLTNAFLLGARLWTVSASEIFSVNINTRQTDTFLLPAGKNKYEYDFIPDDNGFLWIATKTGLLAFDMRNHRFQQFGSGDGLYNDVADVTFARLGNGRIVMAGNTYITSFSPAIAQQPTDAAPLLFTGAMANGLEKNVKGETIYFSWREKNITLQWALLNYSNPLQNQYAYRLEGVNSEWQPAGNKGLAVFNSLGAGKYRFYFRATSADGMLHAEKSIVLVIRPPFWKTVWFRLLAVLAAGGLFFAVVRYISQRNLKEKILRLEKEQAIEKERNRISRDMHDELGSGLTKIAILTEVIKTGQQQAGQMEKISETARSLVDNLDEMVWALNPKNDSLDQLAAYVCEYANQFLEGTNIECHISLPPEISPLPVGEEKRRNIFMAVKEFLNNTVKHSGATNVYIELAQQGSAFTLTLRDDGRGFSPSAIAGSGNGLKNMVQRITDVGGKATLDSSSSGTTLFIRFV